MAAEKAPRGPNTVASWVYGIINPLLDILPMEISFLERGNVTFRLHTGGLEFIKPIRAHLMSSARRILDDFVQAEPDVRERLSSHDALVGEVDEDAGQAFAALGGPEFTELALQRLTQFTDQGNPYPGGAYPRDKFPLLVAEHVVNGVADIPDFHTDASFWRAYRQDFLPFARGPAFERLIDRRTRLLECDRELVPWFEAKSLSLRIPHDLPAAPLYPLNPPMSGWA